MHVVAGTEIYTAQGIMVGKVDRVIIDPRGYVLTHMVIGKGYFFAEDRVLPVECVRTFSSVEIVLDLSEFDLEALPYFDPGHFRPLNASILGTHGPDETRRLTWHYFWFPPVMTVTPDPGSLRPAPLLSLTGMMGDGSTGSNDTAIIPGMSVYSVEGHYIGTVEHVYGALNGEHTSHIQILMQSATSQRSLILFEWIEGASEGKLRLAVDETFLRSLQS